MTELSFLVDLLLNHKLPKVTRDAVAVRIKEVEALFTHNSKLAQPHVYPSHAGTPVSTRDVSVRHPDLIVAPAPEMPPVAVVAQTPATAAAINSRNQAIAESIAGKVDKVTGRPRKF